MKMIAVCVLLMCMAGLVIYATAAALGQRRPPPAAPPHLVVAVRTAQSETVPRLRVLTLNTFLRPAPVNHHGMHGDAKWQRLIPLVAQVLLHHDVLALQEVWAFRKQLTSLLRAAGFVHILMPQPAARGTMVDSGLVIASRFPFARVRKMTFRDAAGCKPAGPDRHASKGALYAAIEAPNHKQYHVFNTHMQATYTREPSASEAAALHCQLDALLRFVADNTAAASDTAAAAVIVAGDLNVPPEWVRPTMEAAGLRDVLRPDDATPTIHIVYDADGRELSTVTRMCAKCAARYAGYAPVAVRVDHVWVQHVSVHAARVVPTHGVSDHDGVFAEVH